MRLRKDGNPWGEAHNAWSHAEEQRLSELAGTASVEVLAETLCREFGNKRTPASIRIRAKRLGISLWRIGFTMRDMERLFGTNHRVIRRWWIEPGLLIGARRIQRGPYEGWIFAECEVETFIRRCGYAYDWRVMQVGHPLRALAQVQARSDPWITFDELAEVVGISRGNLMRWMRRGLIPHQRRHKAGKGGWIMIRAADVAEIRDRIQQAQREGIERSYAKFTAMRRASGIKAA